MKIQIDRASFLTALRTVAQASPKRTTLPITACVLIERVPDDGALRASDLLSLRCTNLDLTISRTVGATVTDGAPLAVSASVLADVLGSISASSVTLSTRAGGNQLEIAYAGGSSRLATMNADDFPTAPTVPDGNLLTVPAEALRVAIARVVFAAATDDNRPALAAVLWRIRPGLLTLAAADGFRLAVQSVPVEYDGEPADLLVPATAVAAFAKSIAVSDVRVRWAPGFVEADAGGGVYTSNLITGKFPNYETLIPSTFTSTVRLSVEAFRSLVRTVAVMAHATRILRLVGQDGTLTIMATESEVGDSIGRTDAETEGEPLRIALNATLLSEALAVLPAVASVELRANTPSTACVLRVAGGDRRDVHVLMPVTVPIEAFALPEREAVLGASKN